MDIRKWYSFEKAKKGRFICPSCGSGTGPKGTGALSINENGTHITCFTGSCALSGRGQDVLGALRILWDCTETEVFERIGIEINKGENRALDWNNEIQEGKYKRKPAAAQPEPEPDYTEYFKQCAARIKETLYHRGLSDETLEKYQVGYDPAWRHPKAPDKAPATPRLIVPTSEHSYIARDTRETIPDNQQMYKKQKTGKQRIFNAAALWEDSTDPVFIVEGEIDALSIIDCGAQAVGMGSINNTGILFNTAIEKPIKRPIVVCLDKDEKPETQQKVNETVDKIREEFRKQGISIFTGIDYEIVKAPYKDANENLMKDRAGLADQIRTVTEKVKQESDDIKEDQKAAYIAEFGAGAAVDKLRIEIEWSKEHPPIATGFERLDDILDGGLYDGLVSVGAISSLGKTTFVMQMCDQIAMHNDTDILIFSLEMGREELVSKSISRRTYEKAQNETNASLAKTARGITAGYKYKTYSEAEINAIDTSIEDYRKQAADRIFIIEGIGTITVETVKQAVYRHIRLTGRKPVVVIDYMQILAPVDVRASDKQNIDNTVIELKRLARDQRIPVIVISSFNRTNYNVAETSFEAFKESGAIEYTSDIVIALQIMYPPDMTKEAEIKKYTEKEKRKTPRDIELKILKNRQGQTGDRIWYQYNAKYNLYRELTEDEEQEQRFGTNW